MGSAGYVASTWIKARHGYSLQENGRDIHRVDPAAERTVELPSAENERLRQQVLRLEERIAVVERIVTDPADRITRDIDQLR